MKHFVIPVVLITIALALNVVISEKVARANWDRELNLMMMGKGTYYGGTMDDPRIALAEKELRNAKLFQYARIQERYYRRQNEKGN